MATERKGVNRFVMRGFLFQKKRLLFPGLSGPAANGRTPRTQAGSGKTPAENADDHSLVTAAGAAICMRELPVNRMRARLFST
jgi:hypothetical protein